MPPRFSVIIPVYNRAKTVLPTLESVRAQTFGDFECIVVDDGSKDGEELKAVVESLGDPRFRYVRRENGGGSAARNTGIDEAKGEFVAFLDSDDRWLPEKLERDSVACAVNCVVFSKVMVERAGRIVEFRPRRGPYTGERIDEYLACRGGFTQTSTLVLPRMLAREVRFDERLNFGQDTDFPIRLAAAGVTFRMLSESSVIMADDETGNRVSRSQDWRTALAWLDSAGPLITRQAYIAYRGWHIARMAANSGELRLAARFYLSALAHGALAPRIAAKAFGQIAIPRSVYSRLRR